jgi:hypothetical protein
MRFLILFLLSVAASLCTFLTEARADIIRAYIFNPELRYEKSADNELVNRNPLSFSVGYQFTRFSALLEYSQFDETSSTGVYSVKRTHQDMMLWGRFHALAWTFGDSRQTIQAYGGIGGGGYKERLVTNFNGDSQTDSGDPKFVTGFSAGLEYSVRIDERFLFTSAVEGRAFVNSELDPNPMWSAILRLGLGIFI